jgi:hypothetical protein
MARRLSHRSANAPWTDAELADAVDVYVFLLRAQAAGLSYRAEATAGAMLEEGLPGRNDASLRYRFRNISAVVQEMGGPILHDYSAAERVGAGVRERIHRLLLGNPQFERILAVRVSAPAALGSAEDSRAEALAALSMVRQHLDEVERQLLGMGHNNPPEPIAPEPDRRAAFTQARSDIEALEVEVAKPNADAKVVALRSESLLQFGVKLTVWLGQRTTKFVDATLAALGPALALKVTGLLPELIDALGAVARTLPN